MDYTVSPSGEETFVILKVTGNITRQTIMPGVVAAHALGGKLALDCYLVDATDATNIETITDNYTFAYSDMRNTEGIDKYARIAVLVSPDDHSHDFVETVARNAGLNFRLFRDRDQAEGFLR